MLPFLQANWIWIVLVVAMLAMHSRHGGGCGGHHQHDEQNRRAGSDRLSVPPRTTNGDVAQPPEEQTADAAVRTGQSNLSQHRGC